MQGRLAKIIRNRVPILTRRHRLRIERVNWHHLGSRSWLLLSPDTFQRLGASRAKFDIERAMPALAQRIAAGEASEAVFASVPVK